MTNNLKMQSEPVLLINPKYSFCQALYKILPLEISQQLAAFPKNDRVEFIAQTHNLLKKNFQYYKAKQISLILELIVDPDESIKWLRTEPERGFFEIFSALTGLKEYEEVERQLQFKEKALKLKEQMQDKADHQKQSIVCRKSIGLLIACAIKLTIYFLGKGYNLKGQLKEFITRGQYGYIRGTFIGALPSIVEKEFSENEFYLSTNRTNFKNYLIKILKIGEVQVVASPNF